MAATEKSVEMQILPVARTSTHVSVALKDGEQHIHGDRSELAHDGACQCPCVCIGRPVTGCALAALPNAATTAALRTWARGLLRSAVQTRKVNRMLSAHCYARGVAPKLWKAFFYVTVRSGRSLLVC